MRAHLVRIVDPLGGAVAWFAPDFGGICVGFAVRASGRREGGWVHVLHSAGPSDLPGSAGVSGFGVRYALRPASADRTIADPLGALLPIQPWQFIERDPTAVVLETTVSTRVEEHQGAAAVRLRLTAWLDDGTLSFSLDAAHHGDEAIPLHLGFQAAFAPDRFGSGVSVAAARGPAGHGDEQGMIPDNTVLMPGEYALRPCMDDGMILAVPPTAQMFPDRVALRATLSGPSLLRYLLCPDEINALALLACDPPPPIATLPSAPRFNASVSLAATVHDDGR